MPDTTEKQARTPKSPADQLADLQAQLKGAQLKRKELDANIARIEVRIERLRHANPDLAGGEG